MTRCSERCRIARVNCIHAVASTAAGGPRASRARLGRSRPPLEAALQEGSAAAEPFDRRRKQKVTDGRCRDADTDERTFLSSFTNTLPYVRTIMFDIVRRE
jgi:hypothetical protein